MNYIKDSEENVQNNQDKEKNNNIINIKENIIK